MSKLKIILTRRWPSACEEALAAFADVVLNEDDHPFTHDELMNAMSSCDVLGATVTDAITEPLLKSPDRRVRMIGNFGVGFNHIDMRAAASCGVLVSNTPGVLTAATADLAMTLILMCARRTGEGERMLRAGRWEGWCPTALLGAQVTGATLGIVGMGRIGQALARRAHHGFGMDILYYNRTRLPDELEQQINARYVPLDTLLASAEFVSLNCPSNAETHHLINAIALSNMSANSYLINTARGDVVDEDALVEALSSGAIAGAGLDVYEREPVVHAGLLNLENVVLLPHQGSGTHTTREAMGNKVVENIRAFANGEPLPDQVS